MKQYKDFLELQLRHLLTKIMKKGVQKEESGIYKLRIKQINMNVLDGDL